jgi:hypothetical protein
MNGLPSGWNIQLMLQTILKRYFLTEEFEKAKKSDPLLLHPNLDKWSEFVTMPSSPANYKLPRGWFAFLLFTPICRDLFDMEPRYIAFATNTEPEKQAGKAGKAGSSKKGRKKQRLGELVDKDQSRHIGIGRGISSQVYTTSIYF